MADRNYDYFFACLALKISELSGTDPEEIKHEWASLRKKHSSNAGILYANRRAVDDLVQRLQVGKFLNVSKKSVFVTGELTELVQALKGVSI